MREMKENVRKKLNDCSPEISTYSLECGQSWKGNRWNFRKENQHSWYKKTMLKRNEKFMRIFTD